MQGKHIAILENRSGKQFAGLVTKHGGIPYRAPALSEVPDIDLEAVSNLVVQWRQKQPDIFIFQTGVGTKALFNTLDQLALTNDFMAILQKALVVSRSPKPGSVLKSRKVRIDLAADDPFTTKEIIALLDDVALKGKQVVVQRYGDTNLSLQETLTASGALLSEVTTYRWQLPEDIAPLLQLMQLLSDQTVDMVCFTSASQVDNFFTVAQSSDYKGQLAELLNQTVIASIGPVCSDALTRYDVRVDLEASPPKLGAFIKLINAYFV